MKKKQNIHRAEENIKNTAYFSYLFNLIFPSSISLSNRMHK